MVPWYISITGEGDGAEAKSSPLRTKNRWDKFRDEISSRSWPLNVSALCKWNFSFLRWCKRLECAEKCVVRVDVSWKHPELSASPKWWEQVDCSGLAMWKERWKWLSKEG